MIFSAIGDFGQGGPPGPGLGGLGRGGMGSEIEGMPVGMGAGGEPLGYREQQEGVPGPNFHIPGIGKRFYCTQNTVLFFFQICCFVVDIDK